jgi:glutamate-1-semialdehyde 2,1-aminomutase
MTAGIETLKQLQQSDFYNQLNNKAACFNYQLCNLAERSGYIANTYKSMFTLFFNQHKVDSFSSARQSNMQFFANFYRQLLNKGIYLSPAQLEASFVCAQHSEEELDYLLFNIGEVLQ